MTALVKYDDKTATQLQDIISQCSLQQIVGLPEMKRAFVAASGVATLRSLLTDSVVKDVFMPLQGSQLGFRTDKDSGSGYPVSIVRECLISAFMHGVWATGNEFNIIAGNMYITKNGMNRLVREFPGVSNVVKTPGVPHVKDNSALVPFVVSWQFDGVHREMRCEAPTEATPIDSRIPVRVNNGMGIDAIIGKAERKAMARVYSQLIGTDAVPEGEIIEGEIATQSVAAKATRSSAASVLGLPNVPEHLAPGREEMLKCETWEQTSEVVNLWATTPDELDALSLVQSWMADQGMVERPRPPSGKGRKTKQGELLDRSQHPE